MDQIIKKCIEKHETNEDSVGYCWEYKGKRLIMFSKKQTWPKQAHAKTALNNSIKEYLCGMKDGGWTKYKDIKPGIEELIKEGSLVLKQLS
jgi:hypothetical protein